MRVTFLGGANEIGASCAALDLGDSRILIDCGQRMGSSVGNTLPDFSFLEFGPEISAVLITHAHADHIGALPALEPYLPDDCPIYANEPTLAIMRVMLEDSVRIMIQHRQGEGELPMFPASAVQRALHRAKIVQWGKTIKVGNTNINATWLPAGHILGAGLIHLEHDDDSIVFSGDVSVADQLSVPGIFAPSLRPKALVLESTYGNRLHAHRPSQEQRIIDRVADALEAGGHVLFPTFALGRAQEVLLLLGKAMRSGKIPEVPVYADGLVRAISKVYARYPEELSGWCRKLWEQGLDPIFPDDLPIRGIRDNSQRERVANAGPCVVVASSGMLQGGASQFYAKEWIHDPRNLILVTGYQDEESPGQALLQLAEQPADQPRFFKLSGVRTEVKCQVENCQLSAHADNGELVSLAVKLRAPKVFLVHGDDSAREYLSRTLMVSCHSDVILPMNGSSYDIDMPMPLRPATIASRVSPLASWPPWDPQSPRELDLASFHEWIASLTPALQWITIHELTEIWKTPAEVTEEDLAQVRSAVYGQAQNFFLPDPKRPYILKINSLENLHRSDALLPATSVESATRILRELLPISSGLTRIGFFPEESLVKLVFDFPLAAKTHYLRRFQEFTERTGWKVDIDACQDLSRFGALLEQWLGSDISNNVDVDLAAHSAILPSSFCPEDEEREEIADKFTRRTGFTLHWS